VSTRRVVAVLATIFFLAAGVASAAVTAEFLFGTLTAESDGADPIVVGCSGGMAKVNGADPDGDPAPCGAVESVEITGGPGPNAIDLSAVTQTAFPGAEYVSISGDEGADTIAGSALADEVEGEADGDTLRGNGGNDALSGGEGDDRVLGGAGDDTLSATFGNDSLDGQVGSDRYQLDLSDLGPAVRVADTGTEGTDAIELSDCEGVTVAAGRITFQDARVAVSGIESYPCGYTPPPAPPAPPPPPAAKGKCIVPRLRGRTLTRAKVLLARAHCSVGKVTRVRSRVKRGVVVGQSPGAGLRRSRGAKVALRVSRGP
jgi:Ca2+-binding RTX toxin-like protein